MDLSIPDATETPAPQLDDDDEILLTIDNELDNGLLKEQSGDMASLLTPGQLPFNTYPEFHLPFNSEKQGPSYKPLGYGLPKALLSEDKDSQALLDDLLGADQSDMSSFSPEWTSVFDKTEQAQHNTENKRADFPKT